VLFLLSVSGYSFLYAHEWLTDTVADRIDDVAWLVEYNKIEQASSLVETLEFISTGKSNAGKINLQKAIIQSKLGNIENADKYFQQVSDAVIIKSETEKYYQHLVELINNPEINVNWSLLSGSFIVEHYNDLSIDQRQTAYRELILAQILIGESEKNLAVFTLKQAIKKSPNYRDAYVLLFSITGDERLLEEIERIDPGYKVKNFKF